jgi:effector-binding domain-containing protein
MSFVEVGQTLELKYLLKHSCVIYSHELDEKIESMISFASLKDKVKVDKVLTITKGLNFETGKQKLVMDIYVEMNQPTKGNHQYLYIDNYSISPCVYSKYKGHPQNASMATREVNEYIKKHELESIGPVHQVMLIDKKSKKKQKKNEVTLEVYVQVS